MFSSFWAAARVNSSLKQDVFRSVSMVLCLLGHGHIYFFVVQWCTRRMRVELNCSTQKYPNYLPLSSYRLPPAQKKPSFSKDRLQNMEQKPHIHNS
jgi:hypothetical protein